MHQITPNLALEEREIQIDYIHASGPGGQNVNKVATAVQLRWDVANSPALDEAVKERFLRLAGSRVTADGILILEARRYRTREQNRADAFLRLGEMIRVALKTPKPRKPTKPGVTAKAARVGAKRKRGEIKKLRQYNPEEWE
jgi:ribosome-associated protein